MKKFEAYIAEKGLRQSKPRNQVAQEFFKTSDHVGIEALYKKVHQANSDIGIATVYRTLGMLVESGLAVRRDFDTGAATYEKTPDKHHDHLLCIKCGKIVEFHQMEIERLQDQIASKYGFELKFHKMELYGLCSKCRKK